MLMYLYSFSLFFVAFMSIKQTISVTKKRLTAAFPPAEFFGSFSSDEPVNESHPTKAQHW